MVTITTRREQQSTAAAARKVGGYSELVRLAESERNGRRTLGIAIGNGHVTAKGRDPAAVKPANGTLQKA